MNRGLFNSKARVEYRGTNELGAGKYKISMPLANDESIEFNLTDLDISAIMVLFSRILYERQLAYAEDREVNVDLICDDNGVDVEVKKEK